jgi:hypothetical protein
VTKHRAMRDAVGWTGAPVGAQELQGAAAVGPARGGADQAAKVNGICRSIP